VFSQTNIYHPFPESNTIWRINCGGPALGQCGSICSGNCLYSLTQEFSILGDTLIGVFNYKKLTHAYNDKYYFTGPIMCQPGYSFTPTINYNSPYYYGAFRNDTISRKIYFVQGGSTIETLLYDFGLITGDTIPNISSYTPHTVVSIDSILINGSYHKKFNTDLTGGYNFVIEGLGNSTGLFGSLDAPFEYGCGLSCVQVNSVFVYPDSNAYCPELITSIEEMADKYKFEIVQNSFLKSITIHSEINFGNTKINFYNSLGKLVKSENYKSEKEIIISTVNLVEGIYFLTIENNNQSIGSKKFIVSN